MVASATSKADRRIVRAGAGDHGVGVIDPGVLHAAGKQRGKYFRIVAAAAADLEQRADGRSRSRRSASAATLKSSRGSPRFMAAIKPLIGALLSRHGARGKPSGR